MKKYVGRILLFSALGVGISASVSARELPFEEAFKEAMRCRSVPSPTAFFRAIDAAGRLDRENAYGYDSISCFPIIGGITVDGMTFEGICGFEENERVREQSDYFYRGPGTSPGQFVSFDTDASKSELLSWARGNIGGPAIDRVVSYRKKIGEEGSSLDCSSWIVR